MALQGYYLYRSSERGQTILIARSRIPILGGELLRGVSRFPSVFLVIHTTILVLVFIATLFVESSEGTVWENANFTNITTLSRGGDTILWTRESKYENVTCIKKTNTHAQFWPVAFNGEYSKHGLALFDSFCQAEAPGFSPLLTVNCVPMANRSTCDLDEISFPYLVNFESTFITSTSYPPSNYRVDEYSFSNLRSVNQSNFPLATELIATKGILFRFGLIKEFTLPRKEGYIIFIHNSS